MATTKAMSKSDLISAVAEATEMTKKDAEKAVNAVFTEIMNALTNGDKVQMVGIGTFEVKERAARTGRNPRTGETMNFPATKVVSFKAGKAFKDAVCGK